MKKRMHWILVGVVMLLFCSALFVGAMAETSGTLGSLSWTLDDAGVLTISGSGRMSDFSPESTYAWRANKDSIQSVVISDGVTRIGNYAFQTCNKLNSITIPDSVVFIGLDAFASCGLTSIKIPGGVTGIYDYAFHGCSNLESITIPDSVTNIGQGAFAFCTNLKSIRIPDGVTRIENYMFQGCWSLTSITIPDSVTSIGYRGFSDCSSLTSITIPDSVTSIGDDAFKGCSAIRYANLGSNGAKALGNAGYTFRVPSTNYDLIYLYTDGNITGLEIRGVDKDATEITIPDSVTSIGDFAFSKCYGLKSVAVSSIEKWLSFSLSNLGYSGIKLIINGEEVKNLTIPDSVTSIGANAFRACGGLTSITIPDSVTSIGANAFRACGGLTSITIPDSVTSIGNYAFYNCSNLTDVYYTGTEDQATLFINKYIGTDNVPLTSAVWHYNYVPAPTSGTCGENLTWELNGNMIIISGTGAMYDYEECQSPFYQVRDEFDSLLLNEGITYIGEYAFYGCTGITNVNMPASLETIGKDAFSHNPKLVTVNFVDEGNLGKIGVGAFAECTGLTSVTIPYSVGEIGSYAFFGCLGLKEIVLPDRISVIEEYAFNDTSLEEVFIPGKVTEIEEHAFENCDNLRTVIMPGGVTQIGEYAFSGCTSLDEVLYKGTQSQKDQISIGEHNEPLGKNEVWMFYDPSGFDLKRDGWVIPNTNEGFSYDDPYEIPSERYSEVYNWLDTRIHLAFHNGEWSGNCQGMSMAAILNYTGRINLGAYFKNSTGKTLSEYGYDKSNNRYYSLNKNSSVINEVERMQICQFSREFKGSEVFATNNNSEKFQQIILYLNSPVAKPLLVSLDYNSIEKDGSVKPMGHSIVINTSIKPRKSTFRGREGFYAISVYDPNCPYNNGSLSSPDSWYLYAEKQWLYINPTNGEWFFRYSPITDKWWNDTRQSDSENAKIAFYDVDSIGDEYLSGKLSLKPNDDSTYAFINVEQIQIASNQGTFSNTPAHGIHSTLKYYPYSANSGKTSLTGSVTIPANNGVIQVNNQEKAYSLFVKRDSLRYVHTNDETNYDVDMQNNSIVLHTSDNATFDIELVNESNGDYSSISMEGTASAGTTVITLNDDNTISTQSDVEDFHAEVTVSGTNLPEDITFQCNDINDLDNCPVDNPVVTSGSCGDDLKWKINAEGTLIISGTGTMTDYSTDNPAPWGTEIKAVVISEGVTSIGENAFANCTSLMDITIPASVTNIGQDAFAGCGRLKNVTYNGTEEQWTAIEIATGNEDLLNAEISFYSPVHEHSWSETVYVWADDNQSVTATRVCLDDETHIETETVQTEYKVIKEPTVTEEGEGLYTAMFENEAFEVQTKTVAIPMIPDNEERIILAQKGKNGSYTATMYGKQYIVDPKYATDAGLSGITYKSKKPKIASIDANGKLTLKAAGKTTITVTAIQEIQKGKKIKKKKVTASIALTVVDPTIPTKIAIEQGTTLKVYLGKPEVQLTASAEPANTASNAVTWKSSKPKIVKVASDGTLTPVKAGTAKITATSTKNKKAKATITVTVVDLTVPTGIIIEAPANELAVGGTLQLKAKLSGPDPDVPAVSAVTWKTKNKKIAKVDKNGLVTGVKEGEVTITATTKVGKKVAEIALTVKAAGKEAEPTVLPDAEPAIEEPPVEEPLPEGEELEEPIAVEPATEVPIPEGPTVEEPLPEIPSADEPPLDASPDADWFAEEDWYGDWYEEF